MKKPVLLVILLIVAVIFIILNPHPYQSYPGYVTEKDYQEFEANKKRCIGYSFEEPRDLSVADMPEYRLCYGILY